MGSSEGEGGKLQGRVHIVRVVCVALELARAKSSPLRHTDPTLGGGRRGKTKSVFNSVSSDPCLVVGWR